MSQVFMELSLRILENIIENLWNHCFPEGRERDEFIFGQEHARLGL